MNTTQMNLQLAGSAVELQLMDESHRDALAAVLTQEAIWEFTWRKITTTEQAEELIDEALEQREKGSQLPFAIIDKRSGRLVGTTRIGAIDLANRNAEVGWTWLSPDVWRTAVNTECKFLLLRHCFEELGLMRVQFSVSGHNLRSQRAVERLGAAKEGIVRRNRIKPDGTIHDSVIYGILDTEWPRVKENLKALMNKAY